MLNFIHQQVTPSLQVVVLLYHYKHQAQEL